MLISHPKMAIKLQGTYPEWLVDRSLIEPLATLIKRVFQYCITITMIFDTIQYLRAAASCYIMCSRGRFLNTFLKSAEVVSNTTG